MSEEKKSETRLKITKYTFIEPNTGCWLWERSVNSRGYGQICAAGKTHLAHRVSYESFHGSAAGFFVCHKCDTPLCVNPSHLFLGTPRDNLMDAYRKERKGKITAIKWREILTLLSQGESGRSVAKKYNIDHSAIIWRRKYGSN